MAEIRYGTVVVTIADDVMPPERAGSLSPQEVARLPKPPRGVGLACEHAADALTKAGTGFVRPAGVTPESLRRAAHRADAIDQVIVDLEVVLSRLKQANLLFDAEAWEQLRKINDQVKAQGKHDPQLLTMFEPVLDFFARGPRPPREPEPAPNP